MLKLVKVWGEAGYLHSLKIPSSKKYNWKEKKWGCTVDEPSRHHLNQKWSVSPPVTCDITSTSLLRHLGQSCRTSHKSWEKPRQTLEMQHVLQSEWPADFKRVKVIHSRRWWGTEDKSGMGGLEATATAYAVGPGLGLGPEKGQGWKSWWKPQKLCTLVNSIASVLIS